MASDQAACSNFRGEGKELICNYMNRGHKFCNECGLHMEYEERKLETHYNGHHVGIEPTWLKKDDNPVNPIYSNWSQWRAD